MDWSVAYVTPAAPSRIAPRTNIMYSHLISRPARQLIEQRLLVEPPFMEVPPPQRGCQRRLLQTLPLHNQLRLHGGVNIVFSNPVSDALGKGKVIHRLSQASHDPLHLDYLVDRACVVGAFRPNQPYVERRDLRMLQPGPEQVVPAPKAEAADRLRNSSHHLLHLTSKGFWNPLVGIEQQHPGMAKCHIPQRGVSVGGVVVEAAFLNSSPSRPGEFARLVGAVRIEHVHIVTPGD